MFRFISVLLLLAFLPSFSQSLIFDHNSLNEFQSLNNNDIQLAKNLRIMFRHASVGTTINNALDCLQGTRPNPKECSEFEPYHYDRRNWSFQARANSGWNGKIDDFKNEVENNILNYDVFSFKFCFLDGLDLSMVPCGKPFNEEKANQSWEYLKNTYEELENKYQDKIFIWWTIPLTQSGQYCTEYLNKKIRDYCINNNKILFDIADIECHDTINNYVTNQQGWEIAFKPYCGEQKEGAQACHPNWTASIMLAKIFWVMIVDIAKNYTVNVNDNFSDNSQIYPNPVNTIVIIDYPKIKSIELYSSLGQRLLYKKSDFINSQTLDLSDLHSGLYFIKIITSNRIIIKKIAKQ